MTSSVPELINHVVTGSFLQELQLDGSKVGWWRDRVRSHQHRRARTDLTEHLGGIRKVLG